MLEYYLKLLGYPNVPEFLNKYLKSPSLLRLKDVGYFCGMDYASKDIYNFKEYISRYDHSLTVSLLTYKLTKDKKASLAGLFHDISTPCFSHVIDYMNEDYMNQESTEEYTEKVIDSDKYLLNCLKEDNINKNNIVNFKTYPIVDNKRPKLCADRLDGIILTGIGWTKNINTNDIKNIVENTSVFINEDKEKEIGFTNKKVLKRVKDINNEIDLYCHTKEDNYMMLLLAKITKYIIEKNYISYNDLYTYSEKQLFSLIEQINDNNIQELINEFETKNKEDIKDFDIPKIKIRTLKPILNGKRY